SDIEPGVSGLLSEVGLVLQGGIPSMAFDGELSIDPQSPLRIEPVADKRTLGDHIEVVASAFEWTPNDLAGVFTDALLRRPDWAAWVGYEGRNAVATAQLVVYERTGGLYYVGTVDWARKSGYGEAITRRAIREGLARGRDLITLQASPL